jgi:hypothetical protein
MLLYVLDGGGLNFLQANALLHFLPQFVETFEVEHAFGHRLGEIAAFEDVCRGNVLRDCFDVYIFVEDERAVSVDVEGGFSGFWLDYSG